MKNPVTILLLISLLSLTNLQAQVPVVSWPDRFAASFGMELERDPEGKILIIRVDSTGEAALKGVVPGNELLGWNTLPSHKALGKVRVRPYRRLFPGLTDDQIRLVLLTRGRQGESAEVFVMTATGNNRGIRLTAR
ncbi:MAG: hypothetical protein R6V75_04610 [Bacteroidales bacterium]